MAKVYINYGRDVDHPGPVLAGWWANDIQYWLTGGEISMYPSRARPDELANDKELHMIITIIFLAKRIELET